MNTDFVLNLTKDLIAIRSYSGEELPALLFAEEALLRLGATIERIPVAENRFNILATWGSPALLLTTHLDVVAAPEALFTPRMEGQRLYGRGACDAKGIAATMIGAVAAEKDREQIGILLVVGEELDGIGAQVAARALKDRGIAFLINGEPTEGKLMRAHKGGLGFELNFTGKAAHSGYPECGVDANRALIETAGRLLAHDFGKNPELGATTLNLGVLKGGVQGNVISPQAQLTGLFRTVTSTEEVLAAVRALIPAELELKVTYQMDPVLLAAVPGFETDCASYCTDIPFFAPIGAKCFLYGPGSIHRAHTDQEFIERHEIEEALQGYHRLIKALLA